MQSKEKQNNILVINKFPSNLVKEAIIVLKKEYDFENVYNKKMKENVVKEAEDTILEFIKNSEYEKETGRLYRLRKKYILSKLINFSFSLIIGVLIILVIFL